MKSLQKSFTKLLRLIETDNRKGLIELCKNGYLDGKYIIALENIVDAEKLFEDMIKEAKAKFDRVELSDVKFDVEVNVKPIDDAIELAETSSRLFLGKFYESENKILGTAEENFKTLKESGELVGTMFNLDTTERLGERLKTFLSERPLHKETPVFMEDLKTFTKLRENIHFLTERIKNEKDYTAVASDISKCKVSSESEDLGLIIAKPFKDFSYKLIYKNLLEIMDKAKVEEAAIRSTIEVVRENFIYSTTSEKAAQQLIYLNALTTMHKEVGTMFSIAFDQLDKYTKNIGVASKLLAL